MLFLALSCLQSRPLSQAVRELGCLEPDGLQLTPGCVPDSDATSALEQLDLPTRTHQGFSSAAYRTSVWKGDALVCSSDSVHAPRRRDVDIDRWWRLVDDCPPPVALETMYPPFALGTGAELDRAMDADVCLAVDVAHLAIQQHHGVVNDRTISRLLDYEHIEEIHVSTAANGRDTHGALDDGAWGLDWARERTDVIRVIECHMHHMSPDERAAQLEAIT